MKQLTYHDLPDPVKKAMGKLTEACRPMRSASVAQTHLLSVQLQQIAASVTPPVPIDQLLNIMAGNQNEN